MVGMLSQRKPHPADRPRGRNGLAVALIMAVAPLLMGTRPPWSITILEMAVATVVIGWAVGLVRSRRSPRLPAVPAVCVAVLLCVGWVSALNARSWYDAAGRRLVPTGSAVPGLPATVDRPTSLRAMVQYTALAAFFVVCCDGAAIDRRAVRRMLAGITAGGSAVAAVGLLERAGLLPALLAQMPAQEGTPFGTFAYHANAGALLNLTLAAGLGLATPWAGGAVALCLVGAFVNVSRATQVLTGVTLIASTLLWRIAPVRRATRRPGRRLATLAVLVTVITLVAIAGGPARHRWRSIGQELSPDTSRPILWRVCLSLLRTSGPFGLALQRRIRTTPDAESGNAS